MSPPPLDGALCVDGNHLSFCLSVSPGPEPGSRTEGRSKQKVGRKEADDMVDTWPHLEVEKSVNVYTD